jgi:hypothetical protein
VAGTDDDYIILFWINKHPLFSAKEFRANQQFAQFKLLVRGVSQIIESVSTSSAWILEEGQT